MIRPKLDTAGIGLASLCIVHCLALPLAAAALPMFAGVLALPEWFHLAMVAAAVPVSGAALLRGARRHGAPWPIAPGAAALALLVAAVVAAPDDAAETMLTVTGSLLLIAAHLWNWRLHRRLR